MVFRKNYDYLALISLLIVSFVGILLIYSSDYNISGSLTKNEYIKQTFWVIIGFF
ncbi:rod shape-determining protein RodA, partial [Borreliella americana]|nr:rod shape-determining protein RodA [Borreliella americana]